MPSHLGSGYWPDPGRLFPALQGGALRDIGARAVQAGFLVVPQDEPNRPLGPDVGRGKDARELHHQRGAGSVIVRRLSPPMSVHVRADDVHLLGMRRADLGAVHFFARAALAGLRIERAQFLIRLTRRVGIDAGCGAQTAQAPPARRRVGAARDRRPARRGRLTRKIRVVQANRVGAAVALEPRFDPVDRGAIAIRPLPAVAELRESLDRGFVFLEVEPPHHDCDRIALRIRRRRGAHAANYSGPGKSSGRQDGEE